MTLVEALEDLVDKNPGVYLEWRRAEGAPIRTVRPAEAWLDAIRADLESSRLKKPYRRWLERDQFWWTTDEGKLVVFAGDHPEGRELFREVSSR